MEQGGGIYYVQHPMYTPRLALIEHGLGPSGGSFWTILSYTKPMLSYVAPFNGHSEAILRAIVGTGRVYDIQRPMYTPRLAYVGHGLGPLRKSC